MAGRDPNPCDTSRLDTFEKCLNAAPRMVDGVPRVRLAPIGGGLYLQITPSAKGGATRSWIFRYCLDGKECRLGLGSLSRTNDLDRAKIKALALREQVERKENPKAQRDQAKAERRKANTRAIGAKTFKQCAEEYIAAHQPEWEHETLAHWVNTFATYVYPIIGDEPVADVDGTMILQILEPYWHEANATMKKVRARIAKVLDCAAAKHYRSIGFNPATWTGNLEHILADPEKIAPTKNRPAIPYAEMPAFWTELRKDERIGARLLEILILTALRLDEARLGRWREIDWDRRVWTIPLARMKMRDTERKDHEVPLSDAAVEILQALKNEAQPEPDDFIFHGRDGVTCVADNGPGRVMRAVCKRLKVACPTVHGCRSSFRTWVFEETSHPREVAEAALAHKVLGVEGDYQRGTALEKRRVLMRDWALYVTQSNVIPIGDNVTPLRQTA